jgi:hypothetical protein
MKRHCVQCRTPQPKRQKMTRGLCPLCYQRLYRMVYENRTTWEKLEQAGSCLAATWQHNDSVLFRARVGAEPFRKVLKELVRRLEGGLPVDDLMPKAKQLIEMQ